MLHFNTGECPAIEIDEAARRGQLRSDHSQKDHKIHETESASMTEDKSGEDRTARLIRLAEERGEKDNRNRSDNGRTRFPGAGSRVAGSSD